MDVQPVTARRLLHRDGDIPASPAAGRPDLMGRMNRIDEDDRLVGAHRVEQVLVSIDEGLLFGVVEAARHRLRLAIVKAQTMQQGNQTRAAVAQPECPLHPGSDLSNAAGTMGVDPIAQSDFLLVGEAAAAAFVAEALQPLDAASLIGPIPIANRVVVQQECRRDALTTPTQVEKHDGVRSAGHPMLGKPIPGNPHQGLPVFEPKESRPESPFQPIPIRPPGQTRFRLLNESGYNRENNREFRTLRPSWVQNVEKTPWLQQPNSEFPMQPEQGINSAEQGIRFADPWKTGNCCELRGCRLWSRGARRKSQFPAK